MPPAPIDREPVEEEAPVGDPEEVPPTRTDYLFASGGFRRIGEWRLAGDGFELSGPAPKDPASTP